MKKTIKHLLLPILILLLFSLAFGQAGKPNAILNALYDQGVSFYNQAEYRKAAQVFEQGLEIAKQNDDKSFTGIFYANLGLIYYNLGEYNNAIADNTQALSIKRKQNDKKAAASILTNLGNIYDQTSDYQKALSNYKEALDIFRDFKDQKGIRTNLSNIGIIYDKMDDYQQAVIFYSESLKIAKEIKDINGQSESLTNLGITQEHTGDYAKALECYEEALKIAQSRKDKMGIGDVMVDIGLVYNNLGDYKRSMSYFQEALVLKTVSGDKKGLGSVLVNIGMVLNRFGYYEKAISYYEKAMAIQKELRLSIEQVQANIADSYLEMNEIEKAEKEYRLLGDPVRLGRLEIIRKDYAGAVKYFDRAIEDSLKDRNLRVLFSAYCGKGIAYAGLKDYDRSKENYEKAIMINEEQRDILEDNEKDRFFADKVCGFTRSKPYEGMVKLSIDFEKLSDAFYYSENLKGRRFAEAVSKNLSHISKTLPKKVEEDEQEHKISLRSLRKLLKTAYINKDTEMYASLEKQLKIEIKSMNKFISELRKLYPEYASINYPGPAKPSEVRLLKDEVLIEFEVTDEKTFAFILKNGSIDLREADIPRKELKKKVMNYIKYFEEIKNMKDLAKFDPETGKELYSILFGDIFQNIKEASSIIIVPDEFLGVLPFDSLAVDVPRKYKLGESEYGHFPIGIKYLGDKYEISYAQCATSLSLIRSNPGTVSTNENVLIVSDPIFSTDDTRASHILRSKETEENLKKIEALKDWKSMGIDGIISKGTAKTAKTDSIFPRLEKTKELSSVTQDLFGQDNTVILSGENASEKNVRESNLSKYKYLIFATHGVLDDTIPWINEPSLVLNLVGNTKGYDGFLTMSEVMALKIPAYVCLLTACQTGVGEDINGEGVMGLGRAFQYAGSKNTVMTLWPVAEDATIALSTMFLKQLKNGNTPKKALKTAKDIIRKKGYEHPFFWAGFVIFSD
jgi:tetratricopeptide (TPR) repeat protein